MEKVMGRGYSVPIRGANSGKLQVAGKNSRGKLTIQAAAQSIQYSDWVVIRTNRTWAGAQDRALEGLKWLQ